MIYTNLKGGLGNMLFQIAATISLSIDKNVDASFPNLHKQLRLINQDIVHNPIINHSEEYMCIFKDLKTIDPKGRLNVYSYPFHYDSFIPKEDSFILDGFFQSEKYFKHNEAKIKEILGPPQDVLETIRIKYKNLLNLKTTAIHVRRGDYLKYQEIHAVQPREYYTNALEYLQHDTEKYIVFSDDIKWCKENFTGDSFHFIEGERDYIEMYLMSMLNNVITSNSTFSWWGAWLNNNENKKIIGVNNWFGPGAKFRSNDIIPETWIKL